MRKELLKEGAAAPVLKAFSDKAPHTRVRKELPSEGVDAPVLKTFSEKLGTSLCGKGCSKKALTRWC